MQLTGGVSKKVQGPTPTLRTYFCMRGTRINEENLRRRRRRRRFCHWRLHIQFVPAAKIVGERAGRQELYNRAWRPPAEAATQLQRYSEVSLVFPSIFRSMIRKYCDSRRRAVINNTKIRKLLTYLIFFRTGQPQINSICANCRTSQFRAQLFRARPYSAAAVTDAATQAEAHHLKPTESDPHPPITVSPKDEYRIKGGIILTRAPLITRALTPF